VRQAGDDDALVRLHAIPDSVGEFMHRRATMLARAFDDLILEWILTDAGEGAPDLLDEAIAETGFARFVIVLRLGDVLFSQRR
jgi:hypothetical protein